MLFCFSYQYINPSAEVLNEINILPFVLSFVFVFVLIYEET